LSWGNAVRDFWTTYFSRIVTLETIGAAALLGFVLQFAWSRLPPEWTAQISQYAPEMLGMLGILMAAAPLAVAGFNRYKETGGLPFDSPPV
jgi:hypothetical protein